MQPASTRHLLLQLQRAAEGDGQANGGLPVESPKCMLGGGGWKARKERHRRAAFCEAVSDVDEPSRKVLYGLLGLSTHIIRLG